MTPRGVRALLVAALLAGPVSTALESQTAAAATQVPAARGRLAVDVWINKEEGGVYQSGERMQVYFRASQDAYVLIYNIDTEGYIHLIYPFRPRDPSRVEAGETYRVPARHDPYDLVAEGPPGVEYVVAIASPLPFHDLPWYLAPGVSEDSRGEGEDEGDDLDNGVIVGDPYVGMEKLHRRLVPEGREDLVASADTYFYIDRRVDYPRYVCADCHHRSYWFDPYVDVCSVVEIRVDATWARYAPRRVTTARPRYYYNIRSGAPDRYRAWKDRWSSLDGTGTLRSKFVLERERGTPQVRSRRSTTPPEFKDLRRYRPGRFWQGRDQILRVRDRARDDGRERGQMRDDRRDEGRGQGRERGQERRNDRREGREDQAQPRDDGPPRRGNPDARERRSRDEAPPPEARRGRDREPDARERQTRKEDSGDSKHDDRGSGDRGRDHRDRGGDDDSNRGRDRDRGDRGRGR